MDAAAIQIKLAEKFGADVVGELQTARCDPFVTIAPASIRDVCQFLHDEPALEFDFLKIVTGVDTGESLLCVYHLYSLNRKHSLTLKCALPYDEPELPSVEGVWPAADWHERETFDMLGIRFTGHHNLRRILCPEDWEGHPLRKDYVAPEEYHGISNEM